MKKLLEDLYFGNIKPCERIYEKKGELNAAMAELAQLEEKVLALLDTEGRKLFLAFSNQQARINMLTAFDHFQCGFRMGAKLLIEVMDEKEKQAG